MDLSDQAFLDTVQPAYQEMLYHLHGDRAKKPYAVPYAANASGVLYNKALFAQQGLAIPETWDAFIATAKTFKTAGINPFLLTFTDTWTTLPSWNSMAPVMASPDFFTGLANGTARFIGTHEAVLEQYLEILELCGNDFMGTGYDDGNKAFAQGKAAMMINGNWAIPEFKKTDPQFPVDLFAFPSTNVVNKNTVTSGIDVALAVSAGAKNASGALRFLEFMTRAENAQRYVDEQFAFSAVKGVSQNDPTVAGVKDLIAAGRVSDFPDHSYPSGFDLAAILSQFALNHVNGMDKRENITRTLQNCDTEYKALQ